MKRTNQAIWPAPVYDERGERVLSMSGCKLQLLIRNKFTFNWQHDLVSLLAVLIFRLANELDHVIADLNTVRLYRIPFEQY